ncbi:MAG TPA: transglycosylase domain-containing protein [Burkholderiaceae bacterium]|nr:transglycosylase domain-containing protein [Burkholderiaceae bacterium]
MVGGLAIGAAGATVAAAWWAAGEIRSSSLQARLLSRYVADLRFDVEPGSSSPIRYPDAGPYDQRFGYHRLPSMIERLQANGYAVTGQARMSPAMVELVDYGLFPPYREKNQAGLELLDCRAEPIFVARYPQRVYEDFDAVPPLLARTLLFIENRELLDDAWPTRNPAIEWDRLAKAVVDQALQLVDDGRSAHGGSTLATQIEKYRHSPEGRTMSAVEKLRQMASATLRAYLYGEDTRPRRREIVADYLNTVPLAARPGFGEVNGIGDGLFAWYGRDFDEVNRLLSDDRVSAVEPGDDGGLLARRALAYKQALSLMVAQRRPSHYLLDGRGDLAELTDSHLRILAQAGIIDPELRDAALRVSLRAQDRNEAATAEAAGTAELRASSFVDRKAPTAMRARLASLLGLSRNYDLDRIDASAITTLDSRAQRAATEVLQSLKTREGARAAGLYGFRLLGEHDDPSRLTFAFTLYERGAHANLLRVQTDNHDQPFDINDGARLDLGSTAKLRTLVSYLEIVAELHRRWADATPAELAAAEVADGDALGRWAKSHLMQASDRGLPAMLDAAMARRYSASPAESFFTGGGLHRFRNFDARDDGRTVTVTEALRNSVNLPFIRMMRDIVHYQMFNASDSSPTILADRDDPARQAYLARFADHEGREFLSRFWRKYRGRSPQQAEELLLASVRPSPARLASVFHGIEPRTGAGELAEFLDRRLDGPGVSSGLADSLSERYGADSLSLADRGYVAGVHPLELWLVAFLRQHPEARFGEVLAASTQERQQVYGWLFKTRNKQAQDLRIRNMLEVEAFREIHRSWRRLGYPFESLTPSYASSLGASGDRPAALAELMGIIANGGLRLPISRVDSIVFARDTPYETHVGNRALPSGRVLPAEVADTVRRALVDVVENGTARRLGGVLKTADGTPVEIGGKTGTGDHRHDVHGRGGQLISSRVVNRTASFAFVIGDRYFGTVMAYVSEPYAANYRFTSALPTQLLKSLAPALLPMLEDGGCGPQREPAEPPPGIELVRADRAPEPGKVAAAR